MEPKPVERIGCPGYPTRRQILEGAVVFFLPAVLGRHALAGGDAPGSAVPASKVGTVVAPIFEHGKGRGATGCVVVAPPVFLSEEEGMQILREELAKHGVKLGASVTLKDVAVPTRSEHFRVVEEPDGKRRFEEEIVEDKQNAKPLTLDGADPAKRVGVEFVSRADYFELGGTRSRSTVQSYDLKGVAELLAKRVKDEGKERLYVGLFYDPVATVEREELRRETGEDWETARRRSESRRRDEAKKLLRQQAEDFAGWLKEQKVL